MGQYFELYALTEKGYEYAKHSFDNFGGLKLMEHSYLGNNLSNFLQSKLATSWKGARIYHIGDYAEMEYPKAKNVYRKINWKPQRYVANLDKKVFVDTWKVLPDRYGFRIDPVLLLTALGNGRGGGDYHSAFNSFTVGTWAGDRLSAFNNIKESEDLEEIYPLFLEDESLEGFRYCNDSYDCYLKMISLILKERSTNILEQALERGSLDKKLKELINDELVNRTKGE